MVRRYPAGAGTAVVAVTFGVRWAWLNHPVWTVLAALTLTAAVVVPVWRRRLNPPVEHVPRQGPTVLYQHWFAHQHVAAFIAAGYEPSWFGYSGISNSYPLRCAQHAESSWWWVLIDPALSRGSEFTTREAALAAEAQAIAAYCGIGNEQGNPLFAEQADVRAWLQAYAAHLRAANLAWSA